MMGFADRSTHLHRGLFGVEPLAVHATRRILIPQRQTIIARANVAMTKVLSQWALIGWPSVRKR
jgi:hypothetical protein